MKLILSLFLLITTSIAQAGIPSKFSAFADDSKLYVTVLVDGCNSHSVQLDISPRCRADRPTKDIVTSCDAKFAILAGTELMCPEDLKEAVVHSFYLDEYNFDKNVKVLRLSYNEQEIEIRLD